MPTRTCREIVSKQIVLITVFCFLGLPRTILAQTKTNEQIQVQNNTTFALDLFQQLRKAEGNLFFSPYSISTVLAMTYAGARGNTAKEMAATLRFSLDPEQLHVAFADMKTRLHCSQSVGNIHLHIANSLWPQSHYCFSGAYLSLVKKHYSASVEISLEPYAER